MLANPPVFDVSVTNNGPSTAENVQFGALLPAAFVDGSLIVTSSGCVLGTPGNPFDPMRCNLGNLASGATLDFQITGDVDPAFYVNQPVSPAADNIDLDAWVTSDTFDPNMANNLSTNFVAITESADLSLRKFLVGTPVAGTQIHYEYQIANAGPSYSRNVTLRDFLPSQVEFAGAFVDYAGSGQTPLACGLTAGSECAVLPAGEPAPYGAAPVTVFVNVRIKPQASGTLTNSADVNLKTRLTRICANNSAYGDRARCSTGWISAHQDQLPHPGHRRAGPLLHLDRREPGTLAGDLGSDHRLLALRSDLPLRQPRLHLR